MDRERLIKISKYLSYHLRHHPDRIGLELAPGGWVAVDALLVACQANNFPLQLAELQEVVIRNDKQRFSFDVTGRQIRANQGHSVEIDLQLQPKLPPDLLYHGTGQGAVESILSQGLRKMSRHHVHLSADRAIAQQVGGRHGTPVVFAVDTATMSQDGYTFYCSDNGVWLVDCVPPQYLRII